jgi:hypothetical protein
MARATAIKRGRIEFYDDVAYGPRCPDCTTATTYYQRSFQNGGEVGGWWAMTVWEDARVRSSGPFPTLAEADRIGRQQAGSPRPRRLQPNGRETPPRTEPVRSCGS